MNKKNPLNEVLLRNLILFLMAIMLLGNVSAQTYSHDYQDGKIYFKYKDNIPLNIDVSSDNTVDMDAIPYFKVLKQEFGFTSMTRPFDLNNDSKLMRTFKIEFNDSEKIDIIIKKLNENLDFEYVEKVPTDWITDMPNDTLYNMYNGSANWNWHLDRIKADSAWDITKGSSLINVAIVDNAVWANHPDLTGKIVAQRDVIYNTNNSNPPNSGDPFEWSHGTHCAGLAAAASNNSIGVASIGYDVSIIAVKASSNNSPDQLTGGYTGIQWAASHGANVISMSWGGTGFSQTNQNLITSIYNMGIVLLAAAGNENVSSPHYPSSYTNVISIASTDGNDVKSDFSNFSTTVDLCAPGGSNAGGPGGLLSTTFSTGTYGNYDLMSGTSMATPVASGLAGLIISLNPELTPAQVETIMKTTSDDIYGLNPNYIGMLGSGRINAYAAVKNTPYPPTANFSTPVLTVLPNVGIGFTDLSSGLPSQWQWSFPGGNPSSSTDENPVGISYSSPGVYNVSLTVTNDFGTSSFTMPNYITVTSTPVPYIFITVSDKNPCIGNSIVLKDSSMYNPTSWEWWFDPSTVSFLNGTNANSQNPEVKFLATGNYTLGLRVWNSNGMSTQTFTNLIHVSGAVPNYNLTMEDGASGYFILWDTIKSQAKVDDRAAYNSNFGIHFQGDPTPVGWKGGVTSTTASQAWTENTAFHSEAHICGVDAMGAPFLVLSLDLRQTYSLGSKFSWFRVLVNGVQIPDDHGIMDFNPVTMANDPWKHLYFDLSPFSSSVFDITLQSSTRFSDKAQGEGDNVFIDNIGIINTTFTDLANSDESLITVFPNPSLGKIKVRGTISGEQVSVNVYSIIGKMVYSSVIISKDGFLEKDLDLSFLPSGIYSLSISGKQKNINKRFVIR